MGKSAVGLDTSTAFLFLWSKDSRTLCFTTFFAKEEALILGSVNYRLHCPLYHQKANFSKTSRYSCERRQQPTAYSVANLP